MEGKAAYKSEFISFGSSNKAVLELQLLEKENRYKRKGRLKTGLFPGTCF